MTEEQFKALMTGLTVFAIGFMMEMTLIVTALMRIARAIQWAGVQ